MGTNESGDYDLAVEPEGDGFLLDCKLEEWQELFAGRGTEGLMNRLMLQKIRSR